MSDANPVYTAWIAARGLTSVADVIRFEPQENYVTYPVSSKYPNVTRLKAYDSSRTPKYTWEPSGADLPKYYALPGVRDAITAHDGHIIGAAGEPDTWVLYAAGYPNALNWFGESSIPETLIADLTVLGCTEFTYYLDHDIPGLEAARKLAGMWNAGTPFPLVLRWQPKWLHTGYDLNRLWLTCQCDPVRFKEALDGYETLEPGRIGDILAAQKTTLPRSHDEKATIEQRTRQQIAAALVKRGNRDGVYECPMDHGSDGKDFLYLEAGTIGGCQGKHAGMLTRWVDLARYLEIDVTQIARDVAAECAPKNGKRAPAPSLAEASAPPAFKVVQSDQVYGHLYDLHDGTQLTTNEVFLHPYIPFREVEGIEICEGRKASLVIGIEGGGKTSFLGRWLLQLRADGYDAFLWSSEWSPLEWAMFDVERYNGPRYHVQKRAHMAHLEKSRGHQKYIVGKPYAEKDLVRAQKETAALMALPGHISFLDEPAATVEDICQTIRHRVPMMLAQNRRPRMVFIDYGQLLKKRGGGWDELEFVAGALNSACNELNLHLVLAAQTTKEISERVQKGDYIMSMHAAQGLSPQRFQAVYTLNPVYHADNSRQEVAVINIAKANTGPAPILMRVETALYRHDWTSKIIRPQAEQILDIIGYNEAAR